LQRGIPHFCKGEFPRIAKAIVRPRVDRLLFVKHYQHEGRHPEEDAYNGQGP
jgi:hypothetical protein